MKKEKKYTEQEMQEFLFWLAQSPYVVEPKLMGGLKYISFVDYSKCIKQGDLGSCSAPVTRPVRKSFKEIVEEYEKVHKA